MATVSVILGIGKLVAEPNSDKHLAETVTMIETDEDIATDGGPEPQKIPPEGIAAVIRIEKGDETETETETAIGVAIGVATGVATVSDDAGVRLKKEMVVDARASIALAMKIRGVTAARWLGVEPALL
ncbi:hypothetical protein Trco_005167 [Trichoderma cornu-damae]|uniref:Uncharacterized protein n=1 Tax=Trichoderma cornu-damae TaxID=654480 RepID=A0A9P8QIX6_9HYPO|nr:hypothetical protein Trco_005167 [Trichoderma cornu-damae]